MATTNNTGTQKRTEVRKQQILNAAMTVFLQKGFSGSTTKEIAREAGVAEGTIFRYFKTKKDLLMALVSPGIVQSLADALEEVSQESDEVILKAILKNRFEIFSSKKELVRLMITEAQFHPEIKERFVENIVMKAAAVLERFMSERVGGGVYREIDPRIMARALVGMTGIFVLWREFLQADKYVSFNDEDVIENVVEIFLNGVKKVRKGEICDG